MTNSRTWLWIVAGWLAMLLISGLVCIGQQYVMSVPSYLGAITTEPPSSFQYGGARLISMTSVWISDMMGLMASNSIVVADPNENCVIIGQGYPGTNWAILTGCYSDGEMVCVTNAVVFKGFKFWTTDGSPMLEYRTKANLSAYSSWIVLQSASPLFGYCDASQQYFELPTNVACQFYRDSLPPIGQLYQTNDTAANLMPPPMPMP